MWHYEAPLRDMQFVIVDLPGLPAQWAQLPAHADLDDDTARQVIEEASKFAVLKTRAASQPDGSVKLRGSKIFISGGEQDLTDNIVHLVLARFRCAPVLRCHGIEKKMGIKGSGPCSLTFEGATGWLVGEPNRGPVAMFAMMNAARLHVALQGLAHAEMPHHVASDFLRATGFALLARAWARADAVAASAAPSSDEFHASKRASARHCFDYVLPKFAHALAMVRSGWQPLDSMHTVTA